MQSHGKAEHRGVMARPTAQTTSFVAAPVVALLMGLVVGPSATARAAAEPPTTEPTLSASPRGSYVWVPESVSSAPKPAAGGSDAHVLYLNRCEGGIVIDAGWPDDNVANRSGILGAPVNFPEFGYGDAAWEEVMAETRAIFSPFNITVTDVDPAPAPHDEALVCGSGGLAGFQGAGGVAPFNCGVIGSPITFTFPDSLGGHPRTIAEVIAQEAAHAWGLEHEYKCEDPMTYLSGCGEKNFQQGDYPCGEYQAVSCECGGATQNSYAYIEDLFGPAVADEANPAASIVAPLDGEAFQYGVTFDIAVNVSDDIAVTHVALYLDGALATEAAAEPWGPWPVIDLPQGSHELYVEASDAAGNTSASAVVHIEITPDGAPPDHDDGGGHGDDDDDDHEPSDGDGGAGDDGAPGAGDGQGDDAGDDGVFDGDDAGSLPGAYGFGPDEVGCACTSSGRRGGTGWLWAPLLLMLGWRPRRRPTV